MAGRDGARLFPRLSPRLFPGLFQSGTDGIVVDRTVTETWPSVHRELPRGELSVH